MAIQSDAALGQGASVVAAGSRILVVDDDPASVSLVKQVLGSSVFGEVEGLADPVLLDAVLAEYEPDILLLDINLPGRGGLAVLESLRESSRGFVKPVLVLTADDNIEIRRRALELGANDFLNKPTDVCELELRVRNLLAMERMRAQLEVHNRNLQQIVQQRTGELESANRSLELEMLERKQRENELRAAERRMRFLLTTIPDSIFTACADPPFAITYISDAVLGQFGYSSEEIVATPCFWKDHLHPDDAAQLWPKLRPSLTKGPTVFEYRFRHADGTYRWLRSRVVGVLDDLGKPVEIIGSLSDISDKKIDEEALAAQAMELASVNVRLQEFDKLKSEFLATASHEMRTPLTVIREFASLLGDVAAGKSPEEIGESIDAILRNCDRLTKMLDHLLNFHLIEAGKLQISRDRCSPEAILERAHKDFSQKCASQGIQMRKQIETAICDVLADDQLIDQVLINLVGNAIKYTPAGGSIVLAAERADAFVKFSVADTGQGIKAADLNCIFEPFRQVDRQEGPGYRGTGLGLSICKRIVDLHGGEIRASSDGRGATLEFTIPIWSEKAAVRALIEDRCSKSDHRDAQTVLKAWPELPAEAAETERTAILDMLLHEVRGRLRSDDHCLVLEEAGCVQGVLASDRDSAEAICGRLPKEIGGGVGVRYELVALERALADLE